PQSIGNPLVVSVFSSLNCISNTGLASGVTGYGGSFALVPDSGKWLLAFIMLTGRLELFTVLVIFTPSFWKK
ncbi:MAG: TrkH family potassium uptake protein, partial [Duncaniella sp.]|nr:TrkH family potassium uptake protein [Duncaniella sp.]